MEIPRCMIYTTVRWESRNFKAQTGVIYYTSFNYYQYIISEYASASILMLIQF